MYHGVHRGPAAVAMLAHEKVMHPLLCLLDGIASVACSRAQRLEGEQLQQIARMEDPVRRSRRQGLPCTAPSPLA